MMLPTMPNKIKRVKGRKVTSPVTLRESITTDTVPFSVRLKRSNVEAVAKMADRMGMSSNKFIEECIEGILSMIQGKPGEAINAPRLVCVGRFLLNHPQATVTISEVPSPSSSETK